MSDKNGADAFDGEETRSGFMRFLPVVVVTVALGGFGMLAWYAYHAGTESFKDEDLLLIEADKRPLKEAPEDPGGAQFPNQDKTVYDTFTNEGARSAKVERVLPTPEEPVARTDGDSETKTWINDKLHQTPHEEMLNEPKPAAETKAEPVKEEAKVESKAEEKEEKPAAPEAVKAEEKSAPVALEEKAAAAPVETPAKPVEVKKAAQKPVAKKSGSARIQLGAYQSEAEARREWTKLSKKFAGDLSGYSPTVERADLGDKGVFYRLQVRNMPADAAKSICASLTRQKQACIVPK